VPLPNIERTTLLNWNNFSYLLGDEELVRPSSPVIPSSYAGPSPFSQQHYPTYGGLRETFMSIQEE